MDYELKCFVCQSESQSKSQSADGSSSGKRKRNSDNYHNLDPSTWKIFCHYFYPPPLVGLFGSSLENEIKNEDFSQMPVFCGVCYQTISNLCNLQSQLELIQNQISKIVAQVSTAFVQEENFHDHEKRCDDRVIYSMRRLIRQRYQPSVCLTKSDLDLIPSQSIVSRAIRQETEDLKVGENIYEYKGKWRYEKKPDEDGNGKFKLYCLTCPKKYKCRSLLINHIDIQHDGEPLQRPTRTHKIDDNNFIYDGIYTIQKLTESHGDFYKCGECKALKKTFRQIKAHIKEVHVEGKNWVCEICGRNFVSRCKLRNHMESHDEDKKYICEDCGKQFNTKAALNSHKEVHSGRTLACHCGKQFRYMRSLRDHRRMAGHPEPKEDALAPVKNATPFVPKKCDMCKKEFVSQVNFEKHRSICQVKTRRSCDWCGRLVIRLDLHQRLFCKERFKFNKHKESFSAAAGQIEETPSTILMQ